MTQGQAKDRLVHEPEQQRYRILFLGGGEGELQYRRRGDVLSIMHTEVPDTRRGQGLGKRLMASTLADIEAAGLTVLPVCGYAAHYLAHHPRWSSVLAAAD